MSSQFENVDAAVWMPLSRRTDNSLKGDPPAFRRRILKGFFVKQGSNRTVLTSSLNLANIDLSKNYVLKASDWCTMVMDRLFVNGTWKQLCASELSELSRLRLDLVTLTLNFCHRVGSWEVTFFPDSGKYHRNNIIWTIVPCISESLSRQAKSYGESLNSNMELSCGDVCDWWWRYPANRPTT